MLLGPGLNFFWACFVMVLSLVQSTGVQLRENFSQMRPESAWRFMGLYSFTWNWENLCEKSSRAFKHIYDSKNQSLSPMTLHRSFCLVLCVCGGLRTGE